MASWLALKGLRVSWLYAWWSGASHQRSPGLIGKAQSDGDVHSVGAIKHANHAVNSRWCAAVTFPFVQCDTAATKGAGKMLSKISQSQWRQDHIVFLFGKNTLG